MAGEASVRVFSEKPLMALVDLVKVAHLSVWLENPEAKGYSLAAESRCSLLLSLHATTLGTLILCFGTCTSSPLGWK